MKRKRFGRLTTILLSLFLVCICLSTVYAFPVSAAAATNNGYIHKTDYTTQDPKPTYTATLNENNRLLNELTKKENTVLNKVKNEGKDWVNDAFSLVNAIKNSSEEGVDWEKFGVEVTKNIITSIAGIWGFDGIAGAILDGIESLTSSGQAPLSEVQVLSDDIDKRFNEISDHLYDIEDQLGTLSNQVTSSVSDVLSGTQTQINNLEAKQILRSFMLSGEGNFSYLEYSNYLYGNDTKYVNASEAYYILLLEAIAAGADEQVEDYYNKLFDSLYSNIHIYNQYYYGNVPGLDKSMATYYYDYLSYNPNLINDGTSAEYQALLFALDIYTTYVYSYEILEMCFAYQTADMYLDASLKGRGILGTDTYEYATGKTIAYSTIQNDLEEMQDNLEEAEKQVAKDIAYILGMKDSYTVVGKNGDIHSIGNHGNSFGNIADGQVVYLNIIPDEICDLFELNVDNFQYFINGTEYRGVSKGVIDSDDLYSERFTASVKYGNTELYSIEFTKIDVVNSNPQNLSIKEFSGGSGTLDDPYLISNAVQLDMVKDDLNAHYQLISNITVSGIHSPIGTEEKPFNGSFDGNGYSITNLTVESLAYDITNITLTPTTGIFGMIGEKGVIKNLILNALQVTSDYQKDYIYPENDNSYWYVGGIAGINRGVIRDCTITNDSSITVNRIKQTQDSRTVQIYIGGIAGDNQGIIEYCSTDDLVIDADSYLYYYNEPIRENEHHLYVGGVAAVTSNTIQYCRVSEKTTISAYAKSIADSKDNEKPVLTVYVGGIIADDSSKQYISNIYSNCNIAECKGEIYNNGKDWGKHRYSWDNVSLKQGLYYPTFFPLSNATSLEEIEYHLFYNQHIDFSLGWFEDLIKTGLNKDDIQSYVMTNLGKELKAKLIEEQTKANADVLTLLGGKILSNYDDVIFTPDDEANDVHIELTDKVCDINSIYLTEYFNKLVDKENKVKNIKFIDASGNTVEAAVVGYYGFETYHESSAPQSITVKVFFYVGDMLMCDDVALEIKGKELVDWKIEEFLDTTFDKGVEVSECLDKIFEHGFKLVYIYSNGQKEEFPINKANRNTVDIDNLITSEYGVKTITISHKKQPNIGKLFKFEQPIEFACHHSDFIKVETVDANCKFRGYEIWECQKGCGEVIHKNYIKGGHTYVVKSGQAATCREAGHTQEVSCSVCGEIFESGEWIQTLPHNYISSSQSGYTVDGVYYPANEYHYCTNGNHCEAHQYTVREHVDENGTLVYLYSCFCGYKNSVLDDNIITNEKGEKPQLIITDGYVLNVGDEVVVYVQILNNPEFIGATFGIRYDDGLELINYEEGNIVPKTVSISNEVYNGYNFLWAKPDQYSEEDITCKDGYLLKLTFRYVGESKAGAEQHISVVYGMSNGFEGGFCTLDGEYHMFMAQSGTISVVEHLPGDVNNNGKGDGVVDILDATYIAWSIVGKEDENGNKIQVNARYADVNLDGNVNLLDVLAILQSISGRYGTSLLSSDYKLFFDLNGFICDDVDESVMVKFYDENGNRTKWSENIDFKKYEALMNQLGYTFVGWYTRMDCTCTSNCIHIVKATDFITYDKYQGNQTLYARWEKNKIIFDMGGADCDQFDEIIYSKAYHENAPVVLDNPTWSYDIDYIVDGAHYDDGRIYKDFLGWWDGKSYDEHGNKVYTTSFDLSQSNIGTINLTAVWSEYKWVTPDKTERGYHKITDWYLDKFFGTAITNLDEKDVVTNIVKDGCKIYGKRNPIKYRITYENTYDVVNSNNDSYYITSTFTFKNLSGRAGFEFKGWKDENGVLHTTNKDNYNISDVIASVGLKDITLTAVWEAKVYIIEVNIININKSFICDDEHKDPIYGTDRDSIGLVYNTIKLYYTYGNEEKDIEQGYYTDIALKTKATGSTFGNYTNFEFGGLFESEITNNGHSYASYDQNTCVLSFDGTFVSAPSWLNEEVIDGKNATVYALIVPKQYTITLDYNTSAVKDDKGNAVISVTNTNATKSISVYYNERPKSIATMPESTYYVPSAYSALDGTGYFNSAGEATKAYNISGNTTMYCQWEQKDKTYKYIYDQTTLEELGLSGDYRILQDIDMGGVAWSPLESFAGNLYGEEHCIYNFSITKTGGSGTATFAFINKNTGKIENLTIGKTGVTTYDSKYSVKYNINSTEGSGESYLMVGGFVGTNSGTITNCQLVNTDINATFADKNNDKTLFIYVGGIVGYNDSNGDISNCHVEMSVLQVEATAKTDSGDNNDGFLGGICGENHAKINGCTVHNSTLKLVVRGDGKLGNKAYPKGYLGGIVGSQYSGTLSLPDSPVSGNTLELYVSSGTYTDPTKKQGEVYGRIVEGTVS